MSPARSFIAALLYSSVLPILELSPRTYPRVPVADCHNASSLPLPRSVTLISSLKMYSDSLSGSTDTSI